MKKLCMNALLLPMLATMVSTAQAHSRSESYSHWYQSGNQMTVTVTMPSREVTRLPAFTGPDQSPAQVLNSHLQEQTAVYSATGRCVGGDAKVLQTAAGFVRIELQFECTETPTMLSYRGLFDAAPSHVHYAKFHAGGQLRAEFLLTDAVDFWSIPATDATTTTHSFPAFVLMGMQHIASGLDHIAFLLVMLLVAGTMRRCVIAVTGFTLGHSVSLAAAVLGYVHADSQLVEAFIGFTIALVAIEYFILRNRQVDVVALAATCGAWLTGTIALLTGNVSARAVVAYLGVGAFAFCYLMIAPRLRAAGKSNALFAATTCFGLIHGFGFAGFLMQTGVFGNSLILPLFGFNVGVELGQLVLVAAAVGLAYALQRHLQRATPQLLAAGLCGVGVFWFVGRTLGL